MARFIKNRKSSVGKAPGSLIHIGRQKMDESRIRLIKYSESDFAERELESDTDFNGLISKDSVTWINIDGLHDIDLLKNVKEQFDISSLAMEDILNTDQRPRIIEDKNHVIIILKVIFFENETNALKSEQMSFILGDNYIISIQEQVGDYFDPVRNRLRNAIGKIRSRKADYLQYILVDTIVDSYLHNIEILGNDIEKQEEIIIKTHSKEIAGILYTQKTDINFVRKSIRPVKEIALKALKSDTSLISSDTKHYWIDLEDLTIQAFEAVEIYYTMVSDQINLYQTNISNRANDVMKVLTIFASIFIPLTFIAGIYGTNFDYIPELHFKYGYFAMWGAMIIVTIGMLFYFNRKKWL
ncbi:MAG: magnesium/cobalt transporter CorA [Bacteroidales bacterium]|nr:magnesium/cobalt transporter CorA [Bacteroidales bacterium]